ncbi:MAG: NUDIX hydrolase [Hyphomicrobiaceae bacterium]|nr:NUDIX hydrolase [Hyphomicrobiaceae bacterium]
MKTRQQYAALPYMQSGERVDVLLITRRRSGRWIIPKGWPEAAMSGPEVAALEAYEEAGLKGRIGKKSIGRFSYIKQLEDGSKINCDVTVYPLRVSAQYLDWPEKGQRQLCWLKKKKAIEVIEELDLAALIENFTPAKSSKRRKNKNKNKIAAKSSTKSKGKRKRKRKTNAKNKSKNRNRNKLKRGISAAF